jgi:hypothetical protein
LFQTHFNQFVWHAIGTQRRPSSIPVKLGRILRLDEIRHCLDLYYFSSRKNAFFDRISTTSLCCKSITANNYDVPANGYYNSDICSSRRADQGLVWCTKLRVERSIALAMKYSYLLCYDSVWSMYGRWWHIRYRSLLAILRKKVGKPKEESRNIYGF